MRKSEMFLSTRINRTLIDFQLLNQSFAKLQLAQSNHFFHTNELYLSYHIIELLNENVENYVSAHFWASCE